MIDNFYQVAGHQFRLSFSEETLEDCLGNYAPFRLPEDGDNILFHLLVSDTLNEKQYEQIGKFDDDIASIRIFKSRDEDYRFRIGYLDSREYCTMDTGEDFHHAEVELPADLQYRFFCLNNCLMLLYAFASAQHNTLLMHASVIKNNGQGYLFLGKSGTGKSTHSSLWLKHIEGSELLNDDNPVVRIVDGRAMVYGSPWSGKTPCYRSEGVPVKAIVKLRQAPENKILKLAALKAYAAILPACSNMSWENGIMDAIHTTVEKLVTAVNCLGLDCLPDQAAAMLCYENV